MAGSFAEARGLLIPTLIGVAAAVLIVLLIAAVGSALGRTRGAPWVCDDTRYVDTVPLGRAVVGSAVSPVPGCGA